MTTLTEGVYAGHFLVSEAESKRSRDVVTIFSTGTTYELPAGAVLSKQTADSKYAWYDNAGTDGTEAAAAILYANVSVPASGDVKATIIARDAQVNAAELQYAPTITEGNLAAAKTGAQADLLGAGIIFR